MVALSGYWAAIALKLAVRGVAKHRRGTREGPRLVCARRRCARGGCTERGRFHDRTSARLGQRRIRRPLRRNPLNGRQHWGQDRVDHLPRRGARRRPAAGPRRLRQRRWLSHRGPRRGLPRRATGSAADGAPETSLASWTVGVLVEASRSAAMICVGWKGVTHSRRERSGSTAAGVARTAHSAVAVIRRRHANPFPTNLWIVGVGPVTRLGRRAANRFDDGFGRPPC